MRQLIAIDGAARRNGSPSCVAAGGVYIQTFSTKEETLIDSRCHSAAERGSTNQRGEMQALWLAVCMAMSDALIITDSEYIFNAMTKQWYDKWANNNWKTASGADVKNADLWMRIMRLNKPLNFYHIKGHAVSVGKVTASKLLAADPSGMKLYNEACNKVELGIKHYQDVQALSIKNNGFDLQPTTLKRFIAMNVVADAVATRRVEEADRES